MAFKYFLILAKTEKNGIGYKGQLPWRLKKELGYFTRMTKTVQDPKKQNAVIMGRLTWESMPDAFKPLSNRLNIVLSSQEREFNGAVHCKNLQEAAHKLESPEFVDKIESVWIIGGSKVYEAAVSEGFCDKIFLTVIKKDFPCDVFVNMDVSQGFREIVDPRVPTELQEENNVEYVFKVYEKVH